MSRTATRTVEIDLAAAVRKYRANETQLRRLSAVVHQGAHNAATLNASKRRRAQRELIEFNLLLADGHTLVGELREEANLNQRLGWAREKGQARPELQARLRTARARISRLAA